MKTIYKGKDDLYYVINITNDNGTPILTSELGAFTIEFFTSQNGPTVEFTASDVTSEGILHINASDLQELPDGPLKARFYIGLSDEAYNDGVYNQVCERLTGYFLKTLPVTDNETV